MEDETKVEPKNDDWNLTNGSACLWLVSSFWNRISPNNRVTHYLRGKGMPYFAMQRWNGYAIHLISRDYTRNIIRECLLKHDIIPYFYGPMSFDLHIKAPKELPSKSIKYEWSLLSSDDGKEIKKGEGVMPLTYTNPFQMETAKEGDATHYPRLPWDKHRKLRKIKAVDLGHLSKLAQYNIQMRFTDDGQNVSPCMIMVEFTLKDRDEFYLNAVLLLIGALIAVMAGSIGYLLGVR